MAVILALAAHLGGRGRQNSVTPRVTPALLQVRSTPGNSMWSRTLRPQDTSARDTSAPQKLGPKFKTNHQWSCMCLIRIVLGRSVPAFPRSRIHDARVEVSRTTLLVSKCFEIGAEVSQSVLMPKCLVAEVSGNRCIVQVTPGLKTPTPTCVDAKRRRRRTKTHRPRLIVSSEIAFTYLRYCSASSS